MLSLYRRHTGTCHVHQTKLSPRAKRRYMDCECPIWVYGNTRDGHVPRQSLHTTDLAVAEAQRQELLKTEAQAAHGPRIDDCIERFVLSKEHELGDKTAASYRFQLGRLQGYCAARGAQYMRDLTVDLLEDFKVQGLPKDMADTTRGIVVAKLRAFLRVAFRREWVDRPLAEQVAGHAAVYEQKVPYTDQEVNLILTDAGKLTRGRSGYASQPATFRLLLQLMLETGMRVSDAICYEPALAHKGESGIWVYPFVQRKRKRSKTPVQTEVYLSKRLKVAIDRCVWLSPQKPFWYGAASAGYGLAYQVYDLMQGIGSRCGVPDCRPHRLRDTFAVRALLRGMQLDDVSRLLGHSSVKITEAYYAKWVSGRKVRLQRLVAESLMNGKSNTRRNWKGHVPALAGDAFEPQHSGFIGK
jgi:integrase/recombinase XerD